MSTQDRVEFFVDSNSFSDVTSYTLSYDMFNGASTFTASIYPDSPDVGLFSLVNYALPFEWRINGVPVMRGYIDKVESSKSKNENSMTISGRDMCSVLVDNSVMAPKTYENQSVQAIVQDIWRTSSTLSTMRVSRTAGSTVEVPIVPPISLPRLDIRFSDQATALLTKIPTLLAYKTNYGQTLFDSIANLINSVGLFIYNVPGTDIIMIHRISDPDNATVSYAPNATVSSSAPYSISEVSNVISKKRIEDITGFYKFIRLVGQAQGEYSVNTEIGTFETKPAFFIIDKIESDQYTGASLQGFQGVPKFQSIEVNTVDANVWVKTRENLMYNALLQQKRKMMSYEYTVMSHSPDGRYPYFFNHLCYVYESDFAFTRLVNSVNRRSLLIYRVEYKGSKDAGQTTILEMSDPTVRTYAKTFSEVTQEFMR